MDNSCEVEWVICKAHGRWEGWFAKVLLQITPPTSSKRSVGSTSRGSDWSFHSFHGEVGFHLICCHLYHRNTNKIGFSRIWLNVYILQPHFSRSSVLNTHWWVCRTSTLACANSATRFDKVILIYDSLFILLKSLTPNLHVNIGASISTLVSAHPNFCCLGGIGLVDGNPIANDTINASLHPHTHCKLCSFVYWIEIVNHPLWHLSVPPRISLCLFSSLIL
jgi:hypothetical protein